MLVFLPLYILFTIFVVLPSMNIPFTVLNFMVGAIAVGYYIYRNGFNGTFKPKMDRITFMILIVPLIAMLFIFLTTGEYENIPSKLNLSYTIFSLPFAFLQEILLQSVFVKEMENFVKQKWSVIIVSAFVFSLMHLPDLRVVGLSFMGGIIFVYVFLRTRSITTVGIIHWILANAIYYLLPLSWTNGLKVGTLSF